MDDAWCKNYELRIMNDSELRIMSYQQIANLVVIAFVVTHGLSMFAFKDKIESPWINKLHPDHLYFRPSVLTVLLVGAGDAIEATIGDFGFAITFWLNAIRFDAQLVEKLDCWLGTPIWQLEIVVIIASRISMWWKLNDHGRMLLHDLK